MPCKEIASCEGGSTVADEGLLLGICMTIISKIISPLNLGLCKRGIRLWVDGSAGIDAYRG